MQLSVIIVNYNVKYFLEQCLCSLQSAIAGIEAEVWVVDNASSDNSINYLRSRFPWVNYIKNSSNIGFAKANNQALTNCRGKYVLYLNPDTLLPEDCLLKCLAFMDARMDAGAVGIRMIDGSGTFLPESKRSFPSPLTSLYKLAGLSSLFPKSKTFSRYSLAYLDEHKDHEVDVLAGAFMLVRKSILLQLQGFDETFFMYGEDIDLSYRIQKAGYKNYYFAGSSIIHFKGESTRKGSLNYVKMFYNAMSIFVEKHYSGGPAAIFIFFIQVAIWLRAAISATTRFLLKIGIPLLDVVVIFGSFELVNHLWIVYARNGYGFTNDLVNIALPGFTGVFIIAATLAGIYDNRYKPLKAFYAALVAIVIMLAVYSLLPEKYRFSRAVILFGGMVALLGVTGLRWLLLTYKVVADEDENKKQQQTIIVGSAEEYAEIKNLLTNAGLQERVIGRIDVNGKTEYALGSLPNLSTLVSSLQIREIIFCRETLSFAEIITLLQTLPAKISVRFHTYGTGSIVGSDSKNSSGEIVSAHANFRLSEPYQQRMKRLVDVVTSALLIITFPLQLLLIGRGAVVNAFSVLIGKKTWVGYIRPENLLPTLREGIITITGFSAGAGQPLTEHGLHQADYWYAKNYDWKQDIKIILKSYKRLSGSV